MNTKEKVGQSHDAQWSPSVESLVKSLGEMSLSLQWLHSRSEDLFNLYASFLSIPTIILSTLTGAGSVAFGEEGRTATLILGSLSIAVSIISTLNSYFAFAKRAETHRITAISYGKLYLSVSIEMSLPRDKRQHVKDFLKNLIDNVNRLTEIQPNVPKVVIVEYNHLFHDENPSIARPTMVNGLQEIIVCLEEQQRNILIEPIG